MNRLGVFGSVLAALLLAALVGAQAQFFNPAQFFPGASAPAYQGPGDAAAYVAWWGLRAYSAATAGTKSVLMRRASDNATSNINTLANGDFDTATAATFCASTSCFLQTIYDKVGTADVTQATTTRQPAYLASCTPNGHPCWVCGSTIYMNGTVPSESLPVTVTYVVNPTAASGNNIIGTQNSSTVQAEWNISSSSTFSMMDGSRKNAASSSSTGVWVRNALVFNGASSIFYLDGGPGSTSTSGTNSPLTTQTLCGTSGAGNIFSGDMAEYGYAAGAFSSSTVTAVKNNQSAYW